MTTTAQILGTFETGEQPTITADVTDVVNGTGTSTDVTWTVVDPDGNETTFSTGDAEVENPSSNVWTLLLPVLTVAGTWWIRCQSTAGVIASRTQRLAVAESPF